MLQLCDVLFDITAHIIMPRTCTCMHNAAKLEALRIAISVSNEVDPFPCILYVQSNRGHEFKLFSEFLCLGFSS